jgi:hypothetical protein
MARAAVAGEGRKSFPLSQFRRFARRLRLTAPNGPVPADSDRAANDAGFIAVVPMRLDEVDLDRLALWRRQDIQLPEWQSGSPQLDSSRKHRLTCGGAAG